MNNYNYTYDPGAAFAEEERKNKRRKLRKLFSRFFIALSVYILISQFFAAVIYYAASFILPADTYVAFANSSVWTIVISCVVQYLIAFPLMLLALIGTDKARAKEKTKLTFTDFVLFFAIGEVLMYAGSFIGTLLNQVIGRFIGSTPENGIANIITEIPVWLIFIVMVVIGPIFEEIIFRKLMIDRLSIYGDKMAIAFSAVAFGLMHANLYQFFYAALLGALLGYVYTNTRDVKYTMALHMIFNFMGSIVTLWAQDSMTKFYDLVDIATSGEAVNIIALIAHGAVTVIYSNLQYGVIAGGIFAATHLWKTKRIQLSNDKEIYLSDNDIVKHGIVNVGSILFLSISFVLMVLNLFLA